MAKNQNSKLTITKPEKKFIWLIVLLLIILTAGPYVYGWLSAGDSQVYLGTHGINPSDNFVYYSYIEQAREGHFTFKNLYTNDGQTFGTFNVFWWGVGSLAKLFKLSAPVAFHLVRLILIIPFCFLFYCFVSLFFSDKAKRKFVFSLSLILGGGGPLLVNFFAKTIVRSGQTYFWPSDLWLVDSNIFLAVLQSPHLLFTLTLFLASIFFFILGVSNKDWRYSLLAGLGVLFLANFHPHQIVALAVILLAGLILNFILNKKIIWEYFKHYFLVIVFAFPSLYYHWWLLKNDIVIEAVWGQNITMAPSLTFVLLDLGVLILLALAGLIIKLEKEERDLPISLVIAWSLLGLPLLYLPVQFQARLILGWQIPLVILAGTALLVWGERVFFWTKNRIKYLLIGLVIAMLALPNLFVVARDIVYLQKKDFKQFYMSPDLEKTLDWLKENTRAADAVMAHPDEARLIPAFAGRSVYFGHPIETLWSKRKDKETWDFFYTVSPGGLKKEFLQRKSITHVLVNTGDQGMKAFDFRAQNFLNLVYSQGVFRVYKY